MRNRFDRFFFSDLMGFIVALLPILICLIWITGLWTNFKKANRMCSAVCAPHTVDSFKKEKCICDLTKEIK
ncbi:MAG: hypothetical protein KA146_02215 [Leptospiraceae bacterium]|nr:hypothetical protein [Leptospiraceae bacterium]